MTPHNDKQAKQSGSRVVALINPVLHCRSTCAELINSGVNLVGIVEANSKPSGLPFATFKRLLKKQGIGSTASQVAARLAYQAINRNEDQRIYRELFDHAAINQTLQRWDGPVVSCRDYGDAESMAAIRDLRPDILVVHSQSWVTKRVRALAASGLVIGGHPGLTPFYRGSHSSFWALLNQQPQKIGWSTFHVDKGVDSGAVIVQGRLTPEADDSYMTLNWRGMKQIAKSQAAAILEYDRSRTIPCQPHAEIPPNSEFGLPGLRDYVRYRRVQKAVR
ncbi:formyltransferase family protein [Fuerstiella marisgermanici]|uniref:Methionyl-tRNA formyltransferase n=1 Tax=Fuerstiella marisgermanici TaxID=1891926 RepID=A0A1P8WHG8_9PLAN|nr:formyltransferase family protein [Fuerstiella marisgermanici]APZ93500.1 methionyl-tRNA formyltransferase [Fuerstiella marisgermanici]